MNAETKENIPDSKSIIVILDDNTWNYKNFTKMFNKDAFEIIMFPEEIDDIHIAQNRPLWARFKNSLYNLDFSRISLVIADQFYDNDECWNFTKRWLSKLRHSNQKARVIETSFFPRDHGVYNINNPVLNSDVDFEVLDVLFNDLKVITEETMLLIVEQMTNKTFIYAQITDPKNSPSELDIQIYREKLLKHRYYEKLIEIVIGEEQNTPPKEVIEFRISRFLEDTSINKDDRANVLHTAFVILSHIKVESDPSCYSVSLTRLQKLLKMID